MMSQVVKEHQAALGIEGIYLYMSNTGCGVTKGSKLRVYIQCRQAIM